MNEAIQKAQQFIDKVKRGGIPILHASIFGSWAKGTAHKDSDIDVCVVSPTFGGDFVKEMVALRKIALSVDSRIEPIPFTPEELADPYAPLAAQIRKFSLPLG